MLYVLAVPGFAPNDLAIIKSFRADFEPQRAQMVPPHLTLMFGTTAMTEDEARGVAERVAMAASPFEIVFARRQLFHDPIENNEKLFLLPDAGAAQVRDLHNALYARRRDGELRADIPYEPHMTVATCGDASSAKAALAASARIPLPMRAAIDALTVVEVIDWQLRTIARVALG